MKRGGMPFEETARRLWFRKMPGRGLGRLYGTVLPWRDGVVMEISVTTPFGNGNNVP